MDITGPHHPGDCLVKGVTNPSKYYKKILEIIPSANATSNIISNITKAKGCNFVETGLSVNVRCDYLKSNHVKCGNLCFIFNNCSLTITEGIDPHGIVIDELYFSIDITINNHICKELAIKYNLLGSINGPVLYSGEQKIALTRVYEVHRVNVSHTISSQGLLIYDLVNYAALVIPSGNAYFPRD